MAGRQGSSAEDGGQAGHRPAEGARRRGQASCGGRPPRAFVLGALAALQVAIAAAPVRAEPPPPESIDFWRIMPGALPPPGAAAAAPAPQPAEACDALAKALAEPLTLPRAVEIAVCQNPQARQAWANAVGQLAQVGQAKAAYLPTLTANVSRTRDSLTSSGGGAPASSHLYYIDGRNVAGSWLLLDFGTRAANVEQAQQNVAAAMASRDALLQSLIAATGQAYQEALAYGAAVQAATQAETSAREILEAARGRQRAGASTLLDVLQSQTTLSQATLARVRAEGNARASIGVLAHTLGVDPRTALRLAPDAEMARQAEAGTPPGTPGAVPVPAEAPLSAADALRDIDALVDEALARHPSLAAAQAQLAAAQARVQATRAEGLPTLSLTGGYYQNGRPGTAFTSADTREKLLALTLTIPLFEGFARSYRVREQQAQVDARSAELAAQRSQVALDVWRSYQVLQTEAASVDTSRELLAGTAESLRAARTRYELGSADIVEVLNAQKDEAAARQERIQSLANWRVARLRLLASLGRLDVGAVQQAPAGLSP